MANSPSQRLAGWFAGPQGARLLREETGALRESARRFHGDSLLWLGCHDDVSRTVRGCMVRNRLYGSEVAGQAPEELSSLRCAAEALPLPNNSLDAMVLHHALEIATDARSALREAARVLRPGGRLVVCAFNPVSLWGARRLYAQVWRDPFTGLRLVSALRLRDWLALLGFELHDGTQYLSYTLPFSPGSAESAPGRTETLMKRLQPPVGGVYLISAVKQAVALRPHWREARVKGTKLIPAAYPKSAVSRAPAPVLDFRNWKDLERGR